MKKPKPMPTHGEFYSWAPTQRAAFVKSLPKIDRDFLFQRLADTMEPVEQATKTRLDGVFSARPDMMDAFERAVGPMDGIQREAAHECCDMAIRMTVQEIVANAITRTRSSASNNGGRNTKRHNGKLINEATAKNNVLCNELINEVRRRHKDKGLSLEAAYDEIENDALNKARSKWVKIIGLKEKSQILNMAQHNRHYKTTITERQQQM